ncbi:hypothetical protein ACFYSH_30340 [Streptomyces sp. NPDC005791]
MCSNGAPVYDIGARRILTPHAPPVQTARRAADALAETLPGNG